MKKITFILLALISGTAFAQDGGVNESAKVYAEIVTPISIEVSGSLDFGKIAQSTTAGDVTLSHDGSRTIPEDMIVPGNLGVSVPTFTVTKEENIAYKIITASEGLSLTGGEATIEIKDFTSSVGFETITATEFQIGATLELESGQATGAYTGEVEVTVSYE